MRNLYFILMLFCVLVPIKSFSQSNGERYYYAYNEKIPLIEVENKFIISFQENNKINIDINALVNNEKVEWINDNVCIIMVDASHKEAMKKSLLQTEGLKSIQPMYITKDGLEMGVTDEFVVKYKARALHN